MAEVVKTWNDGGSLSVAYDGDRDGSAVFSSTTAEGLDREMTVTFADKTRAVVFEKTVRQFGMREVFNGSDGEFLLSDGNTLNALKDGISEQI